MAETIGEYFAQLLEAESMGDYMFILAYDQFRGDREIVTYPHWGPLCAHVAEWIAEWRDEPFCGPMTCADAMNVAAQRLRFKEKLPLPKGWLPTIKTLRRLGGLSGCEPGSSTAKNGA